MASSCPGSRARSRWSSWTSRRSIGVRDPTGFRPLCLGRLESGWVLASETPALDIVGANFVRELEPGEMVVIDDARRPLAAGRSPPRPSTPAVPVRVRLLRPPRQPALRPERAPGPHPHGRAARRAGAGRRPTWSWACPSRACPAAEGFARASGIPFGQGLVKNRYIGRSFIAPSQELRARAVRMKLNPLRENIARQAAGRGRRLDRAGHDPAASWCACCARPGPARSTCASRRRR